MGFTDSMRFRSEVQETRFILPVTVTPWMAPTQTARVRVYVVGPTLEPTVTLKNGSVDSGGVYSPRNVDSYAPSPAQYLVCFDAEVRGGPAEFYEVLRTVQKGELVMVREFSRPDRTWVMIAVVEWIPWSALCH